MVASDLRRYEVSCIEGISCELLHGSMFGFNVKCRHRNASFSNIIADLNNGRSPAEQRKKIHFHRFGMRLLHYVVGFLIPVPLYMEIRVTYESLVRFDRKSFRGTVASKLGRPGSPLWLGRHVKDIELSDNDTAICDGHMLEYVYFFVKLIPRFKSVMDNTLVGFAGRHSISADTNVSEFLENAYTNGRFIAR